MTAIKSTCAACGGHIEHPEDLCGAKVPCPHCGQITSLVTTVIPPLPRTPELEAAEQLRSLSWAKKKIYRKKLQQVRICANCGHLGRGVNANAGSPGIELVLWLTFIIPGIIYSLWRGSNPETRCESCDSPSTLLPYTPRGQQLQLHYHSHLPEIPITRLDQILFWLKTICLGVFFGGAILTVLGSLAFALGWIK